MDFPEALLLLAAGLAAGVVNAVAGGGSLITFPAMIAVGLPPIPANVSNSMSVCPGYLASVWGSRADLPDRRWLLRLVPGTVLGTAAGCALLLSTPARAFELVVPFLVLGATAVLAFQDQLRRLVGQPSTPPESGRPVAAVAGYRAAAGGTVLRSTSRQTLALHTMVVVGAVYGGYFGAALGVMLVAGLALVLDETLTRVTAIKNVLSAVVGLTTIVAFAAFGPVNWTAVAVVAPATVIGGYAGARLVRRMAPELLKTVIVLFGTAIGLLLLYRSWT
ncbi:sulfite exporter TauE/SafE family protein [Plantactinospora sp. BC1]|uniref:sulfite exporter TauE/SafE family protein n=1 Tax=Plantactinospora sp. BC1 TaxID=2108470 RepID=UPI000D155070|nr:sulfite exporter TauE/SafE family protein [Plantactinospora sp. BC1]AVT33568.1 sulfite exporter TauE/SafE family protein [Plantactinospora sp. BC1]